MLIPVICYKSTYFRTIPTAFHSFFCLNYLPMIFRNGTHYARDINNVYARKMKFFEKKRGRCFAGFIKLPTFAIAKRKQALPSEAESPKENGRLAQLVQSVCLTSRGSAVRIRQRPQKHDGSLAQLNRAFDYGSKGYRFESYRSHIQQ